MNPSDGPWKSKPPSPGAEADIDFETIGLPKELHPLANWARGLGLLRPLLMIVEAANGTQYPAHTATVLTFARQRLPTEFIRAWQNEKAFLPEVVQLIDASNVAAHIYREYPAAPGSQSPSQSIRGHVSELPLFALASIPLPRAVGDAAEERWIEAMRTWCLIHWLELSANNAAPDNHLIQVTEKLRLAVDGEEGWLALFQRLRGPTHSLTAITRHLRSTAGSASIEVGARHGPPSHRRMLSQLQNFCKGKTRPGDASAHTRMSLLERLPKSALPSTDLALAALRELADQEKGLLELPSGALPENLDLPGQESLVLTSAADETLTPAQQDRDAKGILLASVEKYQFLRFPWDQPNPFEREALRQWIDVRLTGADQGLRRLACGIWLAVQTSTSLRTVMLLEVGEDSHEDWRVAIGSGRLHRTPPRRYNGWRAKDDATGWVWPLAARIESPIPSAVHQVLREMDRSAPGAARVGRLFQGADLEHSFRKAMQGDSKLDRVTSGMLAHWQWQHLFESTLDPVFSQLVSSHPRSGLPGSCAYASYGEDVVRKELERCLGSDDGAEPRQAHWANGAGSELAPIESLLREAFDKARAKVNELARDPAKWIEHHNALITYSTLILLTVTAARPVSSPFEDISWIDFEDASIFVRDKQASGGHTGRLLPFPRAAVEFVRTTLLPHLTRLATLLLPLDPGLAREVGNLASLQASRRLPFLFLLSPDPELAWVEVSESSMRAVGIFEWPLPWNLMRHRATRLLKIQGCDHEVVNAFMDHGEFGTAAYGPYSVRVWAQDAQAAAPKVASLLDGLKLGQLEPALWDVTKAQPVPKPAGGTALAPEEHFGLKARAYRRSRTHKAVVAQVREEAAAFLSSRPFKTVAAKEWDTLLQSMLVQKNGLPHPMGSLRYDELLKWLRSKWQESGELPCLKKRYTPQTEEPSHFTEVAIGASRRVAAARAVLHQRLRDMQPAALSMRKCHVWSTLSLMVDSRIADMQVLEDALRCTNLRIVRLQGRLYVEYGPALELFPHSAFKRYPLHEDAARLIDRAKSAKRKLSSSDEPLDTELITFAAAAGIEVRERSSAKSLVRNLAELVAQANACELPGVLAGYLNGTVVSAALRHVDWVRCERGFAIDAGPRTQAGTDVDDGALEVERDELLAEDNDASARISIASLPASKKQGAASEVLPRAEAGAEDPVRKQRATRQNAAHKLFGDARKAIEHASRQNHSPRRDLERDLRKLIAAADDVAASCRMLVEWLRSLLGRKTKKGPLRLSSILRYFNALSPCFEAVAYEHDLRGADSEEVTEFYQALMEARIGMPSLDEKEDHVQTYRTWELALQRLRDFHRFVRRELAVEDPDWSEIDGAENVLSISPGMLVEKEYHQALKVLVPNVHRADREQIARAFILLCAYRFGLRGAEASGLLRRDWIEPKEEMVVVLVRNNEYRALKTLNARRQVPLLFELPDLERQIARRLIVLWENFSQGRDDLPLLMAEDGSGSKTTLMDEKRLRAEVSRVLKSVTMNPFISLHHARHAFGNRVGALLFDGVQELWPHTAALGARPLSKNEWQARCIHARRLLLGTEQVTRRSTWALARLMGHAHPRTTFRSYVHFLPEWLTTFVQVGAAAAAASQAATECPLQHVIDLDKRAAAPGYLQDIAPLPVEQSPLHAITLEKLWRMLRRYQDGVPLDRAADGAQIERADAELLAGWIEKIDATLEKRAAVNRSLGGTTNLLSHIPPQRWEALRDALASGRAEIESGTWDVQGIEQMLHEMIGPSRQLLLWRPAHFLRFAHAMRHLGLAPSQFDFVLASKAHEKLTAWAKEAGFEVPQERSEQQPQVDAVESGDPPVRIKHRIGVTLHPENGSWLKSSYELVAVFSLVMMVGAVSAESTGS